MLAAWAAGLGLMTWRETSQWHKPVPAGRYAAASGLYVLLGLLAEYQRAAPAAVLMAWGFNLAVWLQPGFLPAQLGGQQSAAGSGGGTNSGGAQGGAGGGTERAQ